MTRDAAAWTDYSEALAFVGNSLLSPMNQTGTMGLEPEFWATFPDFGDEGVAAALDACAEYAKGAQEFAAGGGDAVQRESVEYTKLFVGPPRPAAAPWETMYRGEGVTVGFGQATFDMQRLLREAGLEVSNENNQYADHIGIELLYASVLCGRIAESDGDAQEGLQSQLVEFAIDHPLSWIDSLLESAQAAEPHGYIEGLLALALALLRSLSNE